MSNGKPEPRLNLKDIPLFPHSGYEVDVGYGYLEDWLEDQFKHGLDLEPDFQRGHVWTDEQRIRFVEYQLRGGEGGKVLSFNHPHWSSGMPAPGEFVILDGLQRITAVRMFLRGKLPVFGYYKGQIDGQYRHYAGFRIRVFQLKTRADVLQYYLDMNAGGTPHAEQEIERVRALLRSAQQT